MSGGASWLSKGCFQDRNFSLLFRSFTSWDYAAASIMGEKNWVITFETITGEPELF